MLGKYARVKVVMPIGSTDGTGYRYPLNYGTVYGEKDQTAYIMGIHHPVRNFDGRVIAVLRNKKEKKSIWIVAPKSTRFIVNDILEYLDPERDFPGYQLECLYESSCGAVIFHDIKGEVRYLLIKNKRSAHWGFPKGHIERGETKEQTALREVQEETGLRVKLIEGFSCLSKYRIRDRVEKTVTIFAATTPSTVIHMQKEEIEDYIWLTYDRALSLLRFDNDKSILIAAHDFLDQNNII